MFEAVIDHLWQSTLIVLVAWAATIALRRYGAHWRYWIWFAASMKFLVPFTLIAQLGARMPWPEALPDAAESEWPAIAMRVLQPTTAFDRTPSEVAVAVDSAAEPVSAPTLASQILEPAATDAAATAAASSAA